MTLLPATATAIRLGPPPPPSKGFWQRRLLEPLAAQLTEGASVEKIAWSLAIGSYCAFFPVLGAATPLCLAVGLAFRLNQPVIQIVNWGTAPIYLPLVYAFVRAGDFLFGGRGSELKPEVMSALLRHDPAQFFVRFGATAGHAIAGWALVAPVWIAAAYFLCRPLVQAAAVRFGADRRRRSSDGR